MTPEERQQFEEMRRYINLLKAANTLPKEVQDAISERLNIASALTATTTGTVSAATTINAFPFDLPTAPSRTLIVQFKGVTYELLVK